MKKLKQKAKKVQEKQASDFLVKAEIPNNNTESEDDPDTELIIFAGTGCMPPEPPQKNTSKVKIPYASIEAKPICL